MNPTPQQPNTGTGTPPPSPYGYGAPPPAPQQPQQGAGYGVPTPPAPGYSAPAQPAQAPAGYAPQQPMQPAQNYGGYGSMPPPPKKKKTGLIIAICAIVVALAGIAVALVFLLGGNKSAGEVWGADSPFDIRGDWAELSNSLDGTSEKGYSLTFTNNADSELTYVEVVLFCYDEDGEPIYGRDGNNFELGFDDPEIPVGGTHTPDDNGYWAFENCTGVDYGIPVITYAEFDDGTTWGEYTSSEYENGEIDEKFTEFLQGLAEYYDVVAADKLG